MKRHMVSLLVILTLITNVLTGCGSTLWGYKIEKKADVNASTVKLPLTKKETITGMISYPTGTESDPNKRAIFKRLEKETNVHVDWTAISQDQWGDKISLQMVNFATLPDFIFSACFSDSDLLKYGNHKLILPLEDYISKYMPNLNRILIVRILFL